MGERLFGHFGVHFPYVLKLFQMRMIVALVIPKYAFRPRMLLGMKNINNDTLRIGEGS